MTAAFNVNGETLLRVKGGAHMGNAPIGTLSDLGLSMGTVEVSPSFYYHDVKADDFGPNVPVDVQWMLSQVLIKTTLLWYDRDVLDCALNESMGGGGGRLFLNAAKDLGPGRIGTVGPTGQLLGCRNRIHASGNHFFSLNLTSPVLGKPWRFLRCHFTDRPVIRKIGTAVTMADITIRALPYADPYRSGNPNGGPPPPWSFTQDGILYTKRAESVASGAVIWDSTADT